MTFPPPSLDELRTYAAARVAATSAQAVADAIGISASAVGGFLAGRSPYARFRMQLIEWWSREHLPLPSMSDPAVSGALAAILADVAPDGRPEALADLTETLRRLHAAHPERCPAWVAELVDAPAGGGATASVEPAEAG
jgi:hypothetical protein